MYVYMFEASYDRFCKVKTIVETAMHGVNEWVGRLPFIYLGFVDRLSFFLPFFFFSFFFLFFALISGDNKLESKFS